MKSFCLWSTVFVLSCFGVGCSRLHLRHTPPPKVMAPTLPAPAPQPVTLAPALIIPVFQLPLQLAPEPIVQPAPVKPTPKKTRARKVYPRQKKKIVTDNADVPSNSSPIGQLFAGDSSANPALRQQTLKLIASTEYRLKTVSNRVAANKHDTIAQIHGFLAQAQQALEINDLQGAQTLATKAKILVDELLR